MKTRSHFGALFATTVLLFLPATARAETPPATPAPAAPESTRELTIVVVESLKVGRGTNGWDAFDRIELAFRDVAKERKWAAKISFERFAANLPDYDTELRLFYQGLQEEILGELTFRAWVTLTDKSGKNDFGIVRHRYSRRHGEQTDLMLEHIFRGAAEAIADKIEPVLFPKPAAPKT